jgi:hypothetical protein
MNHEYKHLLISLNNYIYPRAGALASSLVIGLQDDEELGSPAMDVPRRGGDRTRIASEDQ